MDSAAEKFEVTIYSHVKGRYKGPEEGQQPSQVLAGWGLGPKPPGSPSQALCNTGLPLLSSGLRIHDQHLPLYPISALPPHCCPAEPGYLLNWAPCPRSFSLYQRGFGM